jgi:LacI family transcriptional regulator
MLFSGAWWYESVMRMINQGPAKRVKLKDVAEACGTSIVSVSGALRGDRKQVSEARSAKIRAVARKMGYDMALHAGARRLRTGGSGARIVNQVVAIDFSMEIFGHAYFYDLFRELGRELSKESFCLLANWKVETKNPRLPVPISRGEVDGVFHITGTSPFEPLMKALSEDPGFRERPVVFILEKHEAASCVVMDDYDAGLQIGRLLQRHGHRSFFVPEVKNPSWDLRIAGICDGMGVGKQAAHRFRFSLSGPGGLVAGLKKIPECRAIFAGNDAYAVGIHKALAAEGCVVPRDYSLVGFDDNHSIPDRNGRNILTTVETPIAEVGRQAGRMMLRKVLEHDPKPEQVVLPARLIERNSVGPAA